MTPVVTPLDPADDLGLQQALDIATEVTAADIPDFPPPSARAFAGMLRHPWPGGHKHFALAHLGDTPVGFLELSLPYLDNRELAEMRLEVRPGYRRRGAGRALLAYAERLARADGRKHLVGTAVAALPGGPPRDDAGNAFAAARGATVGLVDVRRRLDVDAVDRAALDKLLDAAWPRAAGYSLVAWQDHAPEEYVADAAYLDGRLLADAPVGDLALEGQNIDATRYRQQEAASAARGRHSYVTAARHDASGRLVAVTAIDVTTGIDWHAYQQITLVDPDHRGHRLGTVVKVANLQAVLAAQPEIKAIDTWNAAVNSHMIGINEEMGFRPRDQWNNWQLSL